MIKLEAISKQFDNKIIFDHLSADIHENEFVSIVGVSGSGKTTLLNIIGLINHVEEGNVFIEGEKNFSKKKMQTLRRYYFGYIFQNYFLMDDETVEKNLLISKPYNKDFSHFKMIEALEKVGMNESFLNKKAYQLSGGEQQRIAIARIMLKSCQVILADEPTGNLDDDNKQIIINLLLDFKKQGKTVICATHDHDIANRSDKTITLI